MHIAIAGNIGSGKTTLTRMLAEHYGWEPRYEAVDHNPYLEDFYDDIQRWSFNLEIYFLKQRFKDILDISRAQHTIVQDRSIYEGVYIFAANNHASGNLSDKDFETYMALFEQMMSMVRLPDLMIYLRADIPYLVQNIQLRNRNFEQQMPIEYLASLNDRYEDFIRRQYQGRTLVIDKSEYDLLRPADMLKIYDKIDAALNLNSLVL